MSTSVGRRTAAAKAQDDSTLQELRTTSESKSNGVLVIKLQAICRKAEAQLGEINTALINSSMDIVMKNKPVFDEEKVKLFSIQAALDKQYSQGLLVSQNHAVIVPVRLCDTTEFPAWNYVASELNTAADELDGVDSRGSAGKEKPSEWQSLMRRFGRTMVLVVTGMLVAVVVVEYVMSMQRLYGEFKAEVSQISSAAHFDAVHEAADRTPVLVNWMSSTDSTPWSGRLETQWELFAIKAGPFKKHIHVMKVDCATTKAVCAREKIAQYPTLQLFRGSNLEVDLGPIQSEHSLSCAVQMLNSRVADVGTDKTVDEFAACLEKPDTTSKAVVAGSRGKLTVPETLIGRLSFTNYCATWSIWCQRLNPVWTELEKKVAAAALPIHIALVECDKIEAGGTNVCKQHANPVQSFPTLRFASGGVVLSDYRGDRDLDSLFAAVEKAVQAHPVRAPPSAVEYSFTPTPGDVTRIKGPGSKPGGRQHLRRQGGGGGGDGDGGGGGKRKRMKGQARGS